MSISHIQGFTQSIMLLASVLVTSPLVAKQPDFVEDFKYFSSEMDGLVVLRMDQLNKSDFLKQLGKAFPNLEKSSRQDYGLELSKVERIVQGYSLWTNGPFVTVIHLKEAVLPEPIANALGKPRLPGDKATIYRKENVRTLSLYVPEVDDGEAFCFVNSTTLVMSGTKFLKEVLTRDKAPALSRDLRAASEASDPNASCMIAFGFTRFTGGCKFPLIVHDIMTRTGFDISKIIARMLAFAVTATVGREVSVRGFVVCEKGQPSDDYKKFGEAIRAAVAKDLQKDALPKQLLEATDKIRFSTKANVAEATVSVKDDVFIAAIKAIFLPKQ